jgi:hypothetical protein
MRTWGLTPSLETYLTLACAYARHGDIAAMEKVIADSAAQGLPFRYYSTYFTWHFVAHAPDKGTSPLWRRL